MARAAFSLLERLVAIGGHDYVLRSAWRAADLPAALRGIERIPVARPRFVIADMIGQAILMPRLCRQRGIDIIWNVDPFGAARGGRARVTTVHDLFYRHPGLSSARSRLTTALCYRMVLGGSTHVVAISAATGGDLAAAFPQARERLTVIPHDATLGEAGGQALPREIAGDYILLVGNGTANKNFGVAVAALSRLMAQGQALTLVHVGEDEGGMLARAMAQAHPAPSLVRLARIDDARLAALYAHAQCLVVPSLCEGFCLPIVEAQALGCPVIASNLSAMPDIAGEGALYFDPRQPADLAARIAALTSDPALRDAIIDRGRRNRARYSWERSAQAYDRLFTALVP
ncbi:MAG: glycosyltransferase family 1 protein [Sphingobium sp.]